MALSFFYVLLIVVDNSLIVLNCRGKWHIVKPLINKNKKSIIKFY